MKAHLPHSQIFIPFLSLAAISFILGIIYAFYIKINFIIFYLLALFIFIVLVYLNKRQNGGNVLVILMFFFIGLLRQANLGIFALNDIYYLSELNLAKITLEGSVASPIQQGPFNKSFIFYPKIIKAKDYLTNVSGKVYVRFNKRLDLNYGDYLRIEGRLLPLKDKGYFNKSLIRQGIRCALTVRPKDWITKVHSGGFSIRKSAVSVKEELKRRFNHISSPAREFLTAFILGDREGFSKELYSVFRYTGTVHILAISGLHIGIIVFILLVFLKALRIKLKSRIIITILFLLFYCFITGLRPSVVRAVIMSIVFLLSFMVKREYYIYNSLALAAMLILLLWPWQIFDIGFQLSFISVISIVFIGSKILNVLPKIKNKFLSFIEKSLVVSLAAWIGTTPLVAYYFGIVSLISILANVVIVALMPFILAAGFVYLGVSYLMPVLAKWFALTLEFMIYILILLTDFFKNFPFSYFYVERFDAYIVLIYYVLLIVLFNKNNLFGKRF